MCRLFPDKLSTPGPGVGSKVSLIFTVSLTVTVEGKQDDGDTSTVLVGIIHTVELFGVEYLGIMAKVDELEHRVDLERPLGEYSTKHFAMRVGVSELPTCV